LNKGFYKKVKKEPAIEIAGIYNSETTKIVMSYEL
jgi:uncharacterized pyridoxamine 5'-phosphate oxidase family protein